MNATRWDMTRRDARRGGHPYPVKIKWQRDVRAKLESMGIGKKAFAEKVGASQSAVWDTISNPEVKGSVLVPKIHAALGWDPPPDPKAPDPNSPPAPSAEAIELAHMFERLPEAARRKLRDDAEFYVQMIAKERNR